MFTMNVSQYVLILLSVIVGQLTVYSDGQECSPDSFNFDQNGRDWPGVCQTGRLQSPIALATTQSTIWRGSRIRFVNYNLPLRSPLTLRNDGHSANLVLDPTSENNRAYITGAHLPGRFEVQSVHFHWGSRNSKGSEHTINGQRYDVEMHIVHKNALYPTVGEAAGQPDGLAVLGILIRSTPVNFRPNRLNVIFDRLPNIINCGDSSEIRSRLTPMDLLGNIVTGQFFAYNGSLTTPGCSEGVTWTVFQDVLDVSRTQIRRLYNLRDNRGQPLINNYRVLQNRNGRPVYYRTLNNFLR